MWNIACGCEAVVVLKKNAKLKSPFGVNGCKNLTTSSFPSKSKPSFKTNKLPVVKPPNDVPSFKLPLKSKGLLPLKSALSNE